MIGNGDIFLGWAFNDNFDLFNAVEFLMRVKASPFHCPSYCFSKAPPPQHPPPHPAHSLPPQLPQSPPSLPSQLPVPILLPTPPPRHECQAYALQLGDSHGTLSRPFPSSLAVDEKLCDEKVENVGNGVDAGQKTFLLKSSLKKTTSQATKEIEKQCVKWSDDLGKELTEIREFEPFESGELGGEIYGYPTCACVIL